MNENFTLAYCLVSLALLSVLYFRHVAQLRRDSFRSEIRRIRDRLFDYVWQHGHSFDDSRYREVRQQLNGILRMSRTLTPARFLIAGFFAARSGRLLPALERLEKLESDAKCEPGGGLEKALVQAKNDAARVLIGFIFCQGIFGIFMRCCLWSLKALHWSFRTTAWVTRTAHFYLDVAYLAGEPNLSSSGLAKLIGCR